MTWLALARPLGAVAVLPLVGIGSPLVAIALAVVVALWLQALQPVAAGATPLGELAIGLVLGLAAAGPLWAARLAGALADRSADVAATREGAILERLYGAVGLVVFALCDGPRQLVGALAKSRQASLPAVGELGSATAKILALALQIAAPLVAAGLVAAAARLAIARLGARSQLVRHQTLSLALVLVIALLAMGAQVEALRQAASQP